MPAPETLNTETELETAITEEKLRQLLPGAGKREADPARVLLALRSGTGCILGKIQIALKLASIDTWWDAATTTDRDKAEIKRLGLSASIYYAHYYGLKAEELPQAVIDEQERIEKRADEIAKHYATIATNAQPESATQHDFIYTTGCGNNPTGSPRSKWRNY